MDKLANKYEWQIDCYFHNFWNKPPRGRILGCTRCRVPFCEDKETSLIPLPETKELARRASRKELENANP